MIIYKDIFTGDEVLSDTYKLELIHDVVYRVEGKLIDEDNTIDDSKIGGNKSAEAEDEGQVEDGKRQVINIIGAHQLQEWGHGDKKDFMRWVKEYMKKLIDKVKENGTSDEEIESIKTNLQAFVKEVVKEYKQYSFYIGESTNPDGMNVLCKWEKDDTVPYFYYFKHGLEEEKV